MPVRKEIAGEYHVKYEHNCNLTVIGVFSFFFCVVSFADSNALTTADILYSLLSTHVPGIP